MTGNFSVQKSNGDLDIIGENEDGTFYKHFISLREDSIYIVEDLGKTDVSKYKYEINFNPDMIVPFKHVVID